MKQIVDGIVGAIRNHSVSMAILGIVITLIGGAYAIGFQLGTNRQAYLEDKISRLEDDLEEEMEEKNENVSNLLQERQKVEMLSSELAQKDDLLASAAREADNRAASLQKQISDVSFNSTRAYDDLKKTKDDEITSLTQILQKMKQDKAEADEFLKNSDAAYKLKVLKSGDAAKALAGELSSARGRLEYIENLSSLQAAKIRELQVLAP